MEITIIKTTELADDRVWFKVYLDKSYMNTFYTYDDAEVFAHKLMDNDGKQSKDEIVKTIKINNDASKN